ncbi:MAG: Prefoldin subunit beta [Methanosaeta sp. PtaU1.Bin055]|nr:MAG: Prefoldin subunit beta [Methanosaeta sp. PtaU1.Bin055]
MSTELPPQVQNQIAQLQQLQQQAQALLGQKSQIEMMIRETESAVKELEASEEGAVIYKSVGEVLFKADRAKLIEEFKEKKEVLDLRLKTLGKQEERIQKRFTQLQDQLKVSLGQKVPEAA